MNKMLAYLFVDSQVESELEECRGAMEEIFEQAEENSLCVNKAPLAKALKSLGIDAGSKLEMDPEGLAMLCDDGDEYRAVVNAVTEPAAMEKLAVQGWVAACLGDQGMTAEPTDYRVRFIEIDTAETTDADTPSDNMTSVIKKGREFATTPLPDDPNNPVTHPKAPWQKTMGVGKPKAGDQPKGTPKGAARKEGMEVADRLLKQVDETEHAPDCQCGFCKNKGKIQDINKKRLATVAPSPEEQAKLPEAKKPKQIQRIIGLPIPEPPAK